MDNLIEKEERVASYLLGSLDATKTNSYLKDKLKDPQLAEIEVRMNETIDTLKSWQRSQTLSADRRRPPTPPVVTFMKYAAVLLFGIVATHLTLKSKENPMPTETTATATLAKIDFACTRVDDMVNFYEKVMNFKTQESKMGPYTFHVGQLDNGFGYNFFSKDVTQNTAEVNRQQLNFRVADFDRVIAMAKAHGGTPVQDVQTGADGKRMAGFQDPDNNYIVFVES